MKSRKLWPMMAVLFLVLAVAAFGVRTVCTSRSEGIEDADIKTGDMNQSLAYDREQGILYVGTHNGTLLAWQDGGGSLADKGGGSIPQACDRSGRR